MMLSESAGPRGLTGLLVARPDDYLWFEWAEEGVWGLFDRGTGQTHLLSVLPAEALRVLCQQPMGLSELGQHLAREGLIDAGEQWMAVLGQSVEGLVGLDLITAGGAVEQLP